MKKLFSYLLISSMVVLSSCTNYDDQFDDLNTQINTLKSQIEGFSSLSSGLTALQGTVASLQTAIANIPVTPATDISGLESTQATLTAALTSLAADVKALQDSLSTAATAAQVKTLADALEVAQGNLTDLLAANNVYSQDLIVNSASTLSFAESLGDKVGIINGSVVFYVTTSMDVDAVQAVASKIKTITGSLSYFAASNTIDAVSFDALTGVSDIEMNQSGSYEFPALVSAANITLGNNYVTKVTGAISFPVLETVSTFDTEALTWHSSGSSTADLVTVGSSNSNELTFSKASSLNLASLVRYPEASLSITLHNDSTVDLSALTTTDADGDQDALALTVNGPDALTLSTYETGSLTTDAVVVTLPKAITAPSLDATKLEELHLHNLQGAISLASFTKLKTLDIIGTYKTTGVATTVAGPRATNVTLTTATGLEDLKLAGALGLVSISGASNLTTVSTSGGMRSFTLAGASDLTSLTLGHGPNASSTLKRSDLIITGATSLETLVADSINNASKLDISGNDELTSISLAGLKALATEASQTVVVNIDDNNLTVQSVQLPSAKGATPVVAGKVTTNSGVTAIKAWLDLAIAGVNAAGESVYVKFDEVTEIVDAEGEKYNADTTTKTASTGISSSNTTTISTVENAGWIFINKTPGTAASASVKQTQSLVIPVNAEGNGFTDVATNLTDAISITAGGLTKVFDGGTASTEYSTVTAMAAAINAADFGSGVSVTATRDAYGVSNNVISYTNSSGIASTVAGAAAGSNSVTVYLGTASATFAMGTSALTSDGLAQKVATALNGKDTAGKKYSVTASTLDGNIKVTRLMTGTTDVDYGRNTSFPSISILNTNTAGYYKWSSNASNTVGLTSDYNLSIAKNVVNGLRITFTNNSFAVALTSTSATATVTPGAAFAAKTDLVSGTNHHSDTSVSVPFSLAKDNSGSAEAGNAIDATAWL